MSSSLHAAPASVAAAVSTASSASSAATANIPTEFASFIAYLRNHHIKCVCFDMDRTLVSSHSGGSVHHSELNSFTGSITAAARKLIPLLIQEGFHVAVATFADDLYASFSRDQIAGVELVQYVLKELPCFRSADALNAVPIVTINPDLYVETRGGSAGAAAEEQRRMKSKSSDASSAPSKLQQFFSSKVEQFGIGASHPHYATCHEFPPLPFKNHHVRLICARLGLNGPQELILLDDRDENCDAARSIGSHGLYLTRKKGLLVQDLDESNIKGPVNTAAVAAQK